MEHQRKHKLISLFWDNESYKANDEPTSDSGKRLHEKIHNIDVPEWQKAFEEITEEDCVEYIVDVTIRRTFNGYFREKSVVYDNLAKVFPQLVFEESYADLDHAGDIDYIGKVLGTNKIIGIQIKPTTASIAFGGYSVSDRIKKNLNYFEREYSAKAFVIYSEKEKIMNKEVVEEIRKYLES
jgi:MjaI restriction endonuclease